jgi:hypothetical protein
VSIRENSWFTSPRALPQLPNDPNPHIAQNRAAPRRRESQKSRKRNNLSRPSPRNLHLPLHSLRISVQFQAAPPD